MRIGLMVGSDKERPRADRLAGLIADGKGAEEDGFASFWVPQIPGYLDAMTAIALLGQATDRIELGTAVVPHPDPPSHPDGTAGADHAGGVRRPIRARRRAIASLDRQRPTRAVLRSAGPSGAQTTSKFSTRPSPGRVRSTSRTTAFRVHSPMDVADAITMPILLAALGPTMLRIAGEHTGGTILWMADERAIGDHVAPAHHRSRQCAGRPAPRIVAGVPVALCATSEVDSARAYASEVLGHADFSPNYVRLLEHGDAEDVGDTMAAGDESSVLARLRRYRDAGVTDLAVRIVPLGQDAAERTVSRRRTHEFLASICAEF